MTKICCRPGLRPRQNHDIQADRIIGQGFPEGLTDLSFYSIPVNSKRYALLADHHAQAIKALMIGLCKKEECRVSYTKLAFLKHGIKFVRMDQSVADREF